MDQQQRLERVIETVRKKIAVEEQPLDPAISSNDAFLKWANVSCYNWQAPQLPKIGALRFRTKVPKMDALNMIMYPPADTDAPNFLIFFLITGRKIICHLNIYTLVEDEAYLQKWAKPLEEIQARYPSFAVKDRYPEWMKKYRRPCTVFGLYDQDRLEDLNACAFDYLQHYIETLAATEPCHDSQRMEQVKAMREQFISDIRTQDKAQGMTSKFIGKEKARRIFYEVVT